MPSQLLPTILKFAVIVACADAVAVTDVFPTATSTTLEVQCNTGFSIGGGKDFAAQNAAWAINAPCRLHCQCVAKDGSCKFCCKNSGTKCERHLPLYKYKTGSCLKCGAKQWLHEAGLSGAIGQTGKLEAVVGAAANEQWVSRGSDYGSASDFVTNAATGVRFRYYSGFVACWGMAGNGDGAMDAASCTDFAAVEESASMAPVGQETDFTTPYLSSVLNQGGCGNCYIQAAMGTTTDRALLKMTAAQRKDWTDNAKSFSTGEVTRCHYSAGTGDACDGGDSGNVMKQLSGKQGGRSASNPALAHGLNVCTGGVYGGPATTTAHKVGSIDYYSKWAYGCVKGCTPFQAGFAGPPLPAGITCPLGFTDDVEKMKKGFLSTADGIKNNFHQYSMSCGCGGTLKEIAGACTYCGAYNTKVNSMFAVGKWGVDIPKEKCNYAAVSKIFTMPAESEFTSFAMTGDEVLAWDVSHGNKMYALQSMTCATSPPKLEFPSTTKCTKCCIPRPYPGKAGYQYSAQTKAAQAPKQCSGSGVTAGSSPGAGACNVGTCSATCEKSTDSMPATKQVLDDAAHNVYSPIGMIYGETDANDWNPMFEHFIKDEIKQHGPLAAGFTVMQNFGPFFSANPGGIMTVSAGEVLHPQGGHAVSIVGWGVKDTQKYWLVRNSWARDFGTSGFFRMAIGGLTANKLGFATNQGALYGNSASMKSGSFRRLTEDHSEARRLATVTTNKTKTKEMSHGGSAACTADHADAILAMRTWFFKNVANYKGVSSNCSVPWPSSSAMSGCTAKITKGLNLMTTFHLQDCNKVSYTQTVSLEYDQVDVTKTKILANNGPQKVVIDPTPAEADKVEEKVVVTSGAWRSTATLATALFVVAQIAM